MALPQLLVSCFYFSLPVSDLLTLIADYLAQGQLTVPTLDVVHQPLPFPLPSRFSGINSPTASLFSRLVNTLRHDNRLSASHVRIQHVLSDTMLPENYPISPLVTPSSLARNSDQHGYFAVKTLFSSITTSTGVALPPGQAHICITERTIPPAGEVEILSFLSDATDSGFMIRLNELAPGGIFVLALPTSHGARTFHNKCLSKILDPILRSIVFRLGLQSELAKDISNAIVLKQFLPYDQMQTKIQTILSTANTTAFFPSARPSFKLIHATKGTLPLPFENWYAWWLGQERSRIMALLNYHLNVRGQGLIASSVAPLSGNSPNATRSSVMLELDKEMRKTGEDQLFVSEVEIAVFMVQRVE